MSRLGPREPAILELVPRLSINDLLWVANTQHGPGGHWFARPSDDAPDHDHLVTGHDAVEYLGGHQLPLPVEALEPQHLRGLVGVRDMVRSLAGPAAGWTSEVSLILRGTSFEVDEQQQVRARGEGWDAFIGDLMVPLMQVSALRDRIRTCQNPQCRLVFVDLSKNHTRRWCDNGGCGNRSRLRRFRSRARSAEA